METTYCANCDNEAATRLTITEPLGKAPYTLPLCSQCKDAFDWGTTHATDGIEEEKIEQPE
jgi:hypothetical protein